MAAVSRKVDGYNRYAAGRKLYGFGRSFPTMGPVDPLGYKERDRRHSSYRNAALRKLQAAQKKKFASPAYLRGSR